MSLHENVVLESNAPTRLSRFVAFVYGGVETGRWPRRSFASQKDAMSATKRLEPN